MFTRQIPGFPGYFATSAGQIIGKRGKPLKPNSCNRGYSQANLCCKGKMYARATHQLILETFVGPCPDGMECRHLNGNKQDNRLKNLCWGTHKENVADRDKHGQTAIGEQQGQSKLTEINIQNIRRYYATGHYSQHELAKVFGVCVANINKIVHQKTWKHI